ncbi:MAG: flavocytochrome c, partial [Lacticaseibacillus paracasei]|nr:flavocytochrome c [Lacticaseibacillus paracasei]
GGYLVDGLVKEVKKEKIPLFVNSDVTKLNETDGKISGVTVKINQDKTKKIAAKAVIVTTGGFGASKQMIKKYRPDLAHYVTTNQAGATGDGIKMIEKVGGYAIDMNKIQIHPTVNQSKHILIGEATRGEGGILVNQSGKRFYNEMNTRDKVSAAINKQKGKDAWVVIDTGVRQRSSAIDFYIKDKLGVEGKTLDELAKKMKVPAATLSKTVSTWNEAVTNKKDAEFGRTTGMDHGLTTGPYYAFKIAPGIHYTMGGVKINTKTEVLTKKQQPIPALYAAGEVTGGLHGDNRIGGNSVADIVIFGRQAGTQAAAYVKAQQ